MCRDFSVLLMGSRKEKSFFKNIVRKDGWLDIDVSMLKLFFFSASFRVNVTMYVFLFI